MFLILVCFCGLFTKWPKKLLALSWVPNRRKLHSRSQLLGKLLCHLHYVVQEIQCVVSVADGEAVWSLWNRWFHASRIWEPLGFGSKTPPSSASTDWNSFRRTWGFRILSSSLQVFHARSENSVCSLSEPWLWHESHGVHTFSLLCNSTTFIIRS